MGSAIDGQNVTGRVDQTACRLTPHASNKTIRPMLPAHLTTTLVILLICFPAFSSAEPGKNAPKAVKGGYAMVVLPDTQLYAWKHQKTFLE